MQRGEIVRGGITKSDSFSITGAPVSNDNNCGIIKTVEVAYSNKERCSNRRVKVAISFLLLGQFSSSIPLAGPAATTVVVVRRLCGSSCVYCKRLFVFPKVALQRRRAGPPRVCGSRAPLRRDEVYDLNADDKAELLKGKHLQERQRRAP